ncbi:14589_t:CDS:2, partial [Entrophospora sp. SA101]
TDVLTTRVEVSQTVSSMSTISSLEATKQVLNVVGTVGEAIKPFLPLIDIVTQLHGYKSFLNENIVKEKFESLPKDFDSVMNDLHFTPIVSAQRQSEIDQQSLKEDLILETIHGGILDNNKQLSMVLQEILIIKDQMDLLDYNKNVKSNDNPFKAAQISPTELEDPMYPKETDSRGRPGHILKKKILKKNAGSIDVACKADAITEVDYPENYQKRQAELIILGKLNNLHNISKFYGLSTIDGQQVMVLEWAELGTLKDVYEKYDIGWCAKVDIALEICCGLTFLHSCLILHRNIRCDSILMDKNCKPKITKIYYVPFHHFDYPDPIDRWEGVHWQAPEKFRFGPRQPYNFKCDIFSFGMLLWELAFEKVHYKKWELSKIREYVLDGGRENIQFDETDDMTQNLQQDYAKIIRGAWEDDPLLRSSLQNIFLQLNHLHLQHPSSHTETGLFPLKNIESLKQGQKPISVSEEDSGSQSNKPPQAALITQIMTLGEALPNFDFDLH